VKRKRVIDADRSVGRGHLRAVRASCRSRYERVARRDLAARVHIVCSVVHVHRVSAVKGVNPARKVPAELEREIERHVAGDVRWSIGTIHPPGKVQADDVHSAGAVPSGHGGIEREFSCDVATAALEPQLGVDIRCGPFQ
jgi:hypothetical protein